MAVEIKNFGTLPDGRAVHAYTLRGKGKLELTASDYGCRIMPAASSALVSGSLIN